MNDADNLVADLRAENYRLGEINDRLMVAAEYAIMQAFMSGYDTGWSECYGSDEYPEDYPAAAWSARQHELTRALTTPTKEAT